MEHYQDDLWLLLDIAIAGVLSGIVGMEREKFRKPAGMRTNMIVGSISCFFVAICTTLIQYIGSGVDLGEIRSDPIRIIQAIVIGVSFIGAGTILKSGNKKTVLFLTTAATLLYSSGIGIAVALKQYVLAVGLCLLVVTINWFLNVIEERIN